jgi:hypothetical protein
MTPSSRRWRHLAGTNNVPDDLPERVAAFTSFTGDIQSSV